MIPAATQFPHANPPRRKGHNALPPRHFQHGAVVMIFALIVLVILLIGAVAVMRMSNASLLGAGNLAFRRDLTVQSDVAIARAVQTIANGTFNSAQNQIAANYSATILPINAQGIPTALLSDDGFSAVGVASNDITAGSANSHVTIRYVIDRLCSAAGAASASTCVQTPGNTGGGGGTISSTPPAPPSPSVLYRLSARVSGPRNTQAFFQSTFSGTSQ